VFVVFSKRFILISLPKVNEKSLSKPGLEGDPHLEGKGKAGECNALRIDARRKKIGGAMLPQE
jgi:hypothetical protein